MLDLAHNFVKTNHKIIAPVRDVSVKGLKQEGHFRKRKLQEEWSQQHIPSWTYSNFSVLKWTNPLLSFSTGSNWFDPAFSSSAVNWLILAAATPSRSAFSLQSKSRKTTVRDQSRSQSKTPGKLWGPSNATLNGSHVAWKGSWGNRVWDGSVWRKKAGDV